MKPFSYEEATQPAPDATKAFSYEDATGKPPPGKGFLGQARDLGLAAARGAIAVPEVAVGAADILSGGRAGKALENQGGVIGFRPKQAKEFLSSLETDQTKAQRQEFADADGVLGKAGVALSNPSLIANTVVESAPTMLAGGLVGRGVKALGMTGSTAAAIGEGAVMAGSAAEQMRQQTDDGLLTGKQTALALGTGAVGAAVGAAGNRLGQAFGDADTVLVNGIGRAAGATTAPTRGMAARVLGGSAVEGAEEVAQSVPEQMFQNAGLSRSLDEGVADAAVMGALSGGVMGAGAGVMSGRGAAPAPTAQPGQEPAVQAAPESQPPAPAPDPLAAGFTPGIVSDAAPAVDPMQAASEIPAQQDQAAPAPAINPTITESQAVEPPVPATEDQAINAEADKRANRLAAVGAADPAPNSPLTNAALAAVDSGVHGIAMAEQQAATTSPVSAAQAEKPVGQQNAPTQAPLSSAAALAPLAESVAAPAPTPQQRLATLQTEIASGTDAQTGAKLNALQVGFRKAEARQIKQPPESETLATGQSRATQPTQQPTQQDPAYVPELQNPSQKASPAPGAQAAQSVAPAAPPQELTRAPEIAAGPARVLQNRDRSSVASIAQMNEIAAKPDYWRAGQSRVMENGAPVVFGNAPANALVGKADQIADGLGKRVPVQYAVVESADVLPSHQADGAPIAEYQNGMPGKLRAVAGNGRAAGIGEAYRRNTAAQYRQDLTDDTADLGIDPVAVRAMKAPVLVRVMPEDQVTDDIGDRSNIGGTAALSATEQAANDARRIDLSGLTFDDNGIPDRQSAAKFVNTMPVSERGTMMQPDGSPTRQLIDRITSAAFKAAYGNDDVVRLQAQSTDPEVRNIITAMASAAGQMAGLEGAGDFDIRGAVAEAAQMAVNAKRQGITLTDYLNNADITFSGEAFTVARFMADNIRSAKRMAEGLRAWANYAAEQVAIVRENEYQNAMFGATPTASRGDTFNQLGATNDQSSATQIQDGGNRVSRVADRAPRQAAQPAPEQNRPADSQEKPSQQDSAEKITQPEPAYVPQLQGAKQEKSPAPSAQTQQDTAPEIDANGKAVEQIRTAELTYNTTKRLAAAHHGEAYKGKSEDYKTLRADLEERASDENFKGKSLAQDVLDRFDDSIANLEQKQAAKKAEAPEGRRPAQEISIAPAAPEASPSTPTATPARPATWRKNYIQARAVAKSLGITPVKGVQLPGLLAEIDRTDSAAQADPAAESAQDVANQAPAQTAPVPKSVSAKAQAANENKAKAAELREFNKEWRKKNKVGKFDTWEEMDKFRTARQESRDSAAAALKKGTEELKADFAKFKEQRETARAKAAALDTLTAPTPQDILDQQARTEAAAQTEKSQQRAADERARRERERKDIAKASTAAADTFELGGNAEQNLSGQQSVFDAPAEQAPAPKSKEVNNAREYGVQSAKISGRREAKDKKVQKYNAEEYAAYLEGFDAQTAADNARFERSKNNPNATTFPTANNLDMAAKFKAQDEARNAPTPAPVTPKSPNNEAARADKLRAEADLMNALADLGDIFSKPFKSHLTDEQTQKLMPVMTRLLDAAFRLGYIKFKDAAKFALDKIQAAYGDEVADAITLDHLQGAYIGMAGGKVGADTKRAVIDIEDKAEITAHTLTKPTEDDVPESPTTAPTPAPSQTLTQSLATAIEAGNMPKDNPALKKLVESFDGQPADQARMKQAQEELETAIAMTARKVVAKNEGDRSTFDALLRMYESQPNLNVRTSTSIANQAYSTPAPLAFLASRLAGIASTTVAHEPTAGTGMLLIGANPKKAIVNELNDLRIGALEAQGFTPTQKDAATQQLVPTGARVDAVITNPPFGPVKDDAGKPTKIKVDGFNIGQIDHLIAARALEAMKQDGKATLILGANKATGGLSTDDRIFFNWLYANYNVTGHFEVNGDLYTRQGAGWPVRVISINGRMKSGKFSPVAGTIQRADNWSEVYEKFTQSLKATNAPIIRTPDEPRKNPASVVPAPAPTGASRPQSGTASTGSVAGTSPRVVPDRAEPTAEPVGAGADEQRLNAQSYIPEPQPGAKPAASTRPAKPAGVAALDDAPKGNDFQLPYTTRSSRKDEGVLIPANMAQPTQDALSRLEDEVGDIDEFARKELGYKTVDELHGALMGLQVDSVATTIWQIKRGKAVVIADQCVAAGTRIYDPITQTHTAIEVLAAAGQPINVLSLSHGQFVPAAASAPFRKGVADLFRIVMDDGREITVTQHHRFLTPDGWLTLADGLRVGCSLVCAEGHLPKSLASSLSAQTSNALHCTQTIEGSAGHCFEHSHPCGEPLPLGQGSVQSFAPSPNGVPAHSPLLWRADGQAPSGECSHRHPSSGHHSRNSFSPSPSRALSLKKGQADASGAKSSGLTHQNEPQFVQLTALLHAESQPAHSRQTEPRYDHLSGAWQPLSDSGRTEPDAPGVIDVEQLHSKIRQLDTLGKSPRTEGLDEFALDDYTGLRTIVSVDFVRTDEFFDMWVPGHENYVAEGFVNHNTGIGKGRQAASIIRWAAKQGMIPVFVSVKPSLFTDMYGDLADIGTSDINPFILNGNAWIAGEDGTKLFANKPATHKAALREIMDSGELPGDSNALFMTYSQINVENMQRGVLRALAPNAVFVLDESHNAAGASATGQFMIETLGLAKGVSYLSATYAKRPDNMPLYFKTDIGDAAADAEGLSEAMAAGGLSLQTVVSNNLVKAGQMFRRERSYDGVSIVSKFDTPNRALHERMSNEATKALRAIVSADKSFHSIFVKNLSKELASEGSSIKDIAGNQASASVQHTEFSSVVHNFVKQMLLGLKAQTAADEAIASLKRGEKPVIAVENTMGSFLNEYAAANNIMQSSSLGTFDYRTILSRALERTRVVVVTDERGNDEKRIIPLSELDFFTAKAYQDAADVIDGLKLSIPVSPIDWMRAEIIRAGFSVAEITGRNLSVDYSDPKKPVLAAIEQEEQKDKVNTTRLFNSGKLDALILNVAGSTGISLHASEKFEDQRQRHMIVAQAAGDINIFMQMIGRVHRTGQVRLPKYSILSVDLPTEKRPTAVLSVKMKSLNANTSSNTESATSVKTADILNKYGDQIVQQYLYDNLELARALGLEDEIGGDTIQDDIARKATGRLALQPIETQHAFYDDVEAQYAGLIEYLNKTNQNDLEPRTFDFDAKETRQEVLFEGPDKSTPFGEDAIYGEYSIKAQGHPMKPAEINEAMAENLQGKTSEAHAKALVDSLLSTYADQINATRAKNGIEPGNFNEAKYLAWASTTFGENAAASIVASAKTRLAQGLEIMKFTPEQMANQGSASEGIEFLKSHKIGSTFRVDINGEPFNAVVINIRNSHKEAGNPFSLSKMQLTVAVNGALRSLTIPATQFKKIEVSTIAPFFKIEQLFKEQPANQRETAKIVTGNLLAAYGEIKGARGTIITFTKQDGTSEQGILLPKLFDYGKNTRGDYRLPTAQSALLFLQTSIDREIGRFGIASRDSVVRVIPHAGWGIRVQVPKSKLKGGKFFLDSGLIEAGGDFVSSGNIMVQTVTDKLSAIKVLDLLMKKQALYALPSMADEAKAAVDKKINLAFSRDPKSTTPGMTPAQVQAIADKISAGWTNAPQIVVAANMADQRIPQAARDEDQRQRAMGATGSPEGFVHAGKVYLLADQLASPERAAQVLLHESLGHIGLQGVFGDGLKTILQQIATMRRADVTRKAEQYGLDMNNAADRLTAAEEVLAEMAQTQPEIGFVKRAISAIRNWLRANVPGFKSLELTDADIVQAYLLPARGFVERGRAAGIGGSAAFSRGDSKDFDLGINEPMTIDPETLTFREDEQNRKDDLAGDTSDFDPIVVIDDDGELSILDGHNRASVAIDRGDDIKAVKVTQAEYDRLRERGFEDGEIAWAALRRAGQDYAAGNLESQFPGSGISEGGDKAWDDLLENEDDESGTPDIRFSRSPASAINARLNDKPETTLGDTRRYDAAQIQAMHNTGMTVTEKSIAERTKEFWQDTGKKLAQGLADQFAPIKEISKEAYGLARLAKGASGAFEALLQGGKLKLTDGVYDFDEAQRGGVVETLLKPMNGEHHDALRWVAANRAEQLMNESEATRAEGATLLAQASALNQQARALESAGKIPEAKKLRAEAEIKKSEGDKKKNVSRENLFTRDDIAALKRLSDGDTSFDYTIQNGIKKGIVTRNRAEIYKDFNSTLNGFNRNVLDLTEKSGLIDPESRKVWERDFYVPFYRVSEDDGGSAGGANVSGSMVRQKAFERLKGGKQKLSNDLLDNVLMNWAHLLDASAKNRAAKATLEAAAAMPTPVAIEAPESTARSIASEIGKKNSVVWFMDSGKQRYFIVDDPYVLTAITALEYAGMHNPIMNAMGAFKHALTVGVTASPFFKIRNLIRDSLQVVASAPLDYNVAKNIKQGFALTNPRSDAYFRLLAGGGTIHFGTMMEGSEGKRVQSLVESGVKDSTILNGDHKIKAFYQKYIEPGVTAYNELGNRGEAINRAALYDQLVKKGVSHADASLQARDLMDFSMQGSFTAVRFLTQVVPFMNARIQGLYKLGRAAKEDPRRMAVVLGATAAFSVALMTAYSDDDDWKKREEFDRNNFWWFKFGGEAFRIPKPFEIGAMATLAERGFELAFSKEMTSKRFMEQVRTLLSDNLSMSPIPQMFKPVIDVYANKDSFSGRPIEGMGMDKLRPEYRFSDRTSMLARGASSALNAATGVFDKDSLSPVQIDHMLRGYFGWLGSFVVGTSEIIARPATGQATQAAPDYWKMATGGIVSTLDGAQSRYVSSMYEQASRIEQDYGTWRAMIKEGKPLEAQEYRTENAASIGKYHRIEAAKKQTATLNQQIKIIERGNASSTEKRERITALRNQQNLIAKMAMSTE